MQKKAKQFLDLLESQQLLAPDVLGELHRQVDESKSRLTSELIARLLVDNGHLTKFQATKLIAELNDAAGIEPADKQSAGQSPKKDKSSAKSSPSVPALKSDNDDLGFAEDVSATTEGSGKSSQAVVFLDDEEIGAVQAQAHAAQPLDVIPVAVVPAARTPAENVPGQGKSRTARPVEVVPTEVQPMEVVPVAVSSSNKNKNDGSRSVSSTGTSTASSTELPLRPKKVAGTKSASANPYDSFRILGVGLLLALVLVAGFFLVNYFWRGNAEQRLQAADEAYEQRSYETASLAYREFAEVFPANEKASYAQVRAALAAIRQDAEGAPDPKIGLETALKLLPGLIGQAALGEQQSDLAGVLIALASKFNERADRTPETSQRKSLMEDMDKLLVLINDPQFVGANQRSQQAPTLSRIEEDRQRILREINRDEELATALADIDGKLAANDTLGAYEVRKTLINRYPLLEADQALRQRVQQASTLQRTLVKPSSLDVPVHAVPPQSSVGRSFILANRSGSPASSLNGQVLFVKAKGSVYGVDGASGQILWRHFVGRYLPSEPLRIGEGSSDAIVCQPEQGIVSRLTGSSGEPQWSVNLGSAIHNPTLTSAELFLARLDGTVACLDAANGGLKWATQLPQAAAVSPTVSPGSTTDNPQLYIPADHSNLYLLSRADGACPEVFYLGHRSGSISVPPIWLLGQLFVFENISSQKARIRILATSASGLELQETQVAIAMEGNIVSTPQIDGRRLIIQTDLGQIKVLDVEPTAQTERVNELVTIPQNANQPKQSWLIAANNRVWVADNQLARFDVQVATLNMSRAWIKHDGDRFVGPPQRLGDTLVHARTLRGAQGIRVSASDANNGEIFWETDIAVPVTYLGPSGTGYAAVNSRGMLYTLGNKPIRNDADENPGQGKPAMVFDEATALGDGNVVFVNANRSSQLVLLSSNSPRMKLLSANFGTAQATCSPVAIKDKLAVGLDSGQVVLVDPTTAAIVGAPYQPAVQAGQKVRWNRPAYLPSEQALIIANDLQSLVRLSTDNGLRAGGEVTLLAPLVGPLVTVGDQVCAVQATDTGDTLQFFDSSNLQKGASWALPGQLVSGPYPTADGCLVQSDNKLTLISVQGQPSWSIDFPASPIVAGPLVAGTNWSVATKSGQVWVLSSSDGQVLGQADVGQQLSSPLLQLGSSLLMGSDEGTVLALPIPATKFADAATSSASSNTPASNQPAETR